MINKEIKVEITTNKYALGEVEAKKPTKLNMSLDEVANFLGKDVSEIDDLKSGDYVIDRNGKTWVVWVKVELPKGFSKEDLQKIEEYSKKQRIKDRTAYAIFFSALLVVIGFPLSIIYPTVGSILECIGLFVELIAMTVRMVSDKKDHQKDYKVDLIFIVVIFIVLLLVFATNFL